MVWQPQPGEHYLLRWRFDYVSRPTRYGQWSKPNQSSSFSDMASFQPTDGLLRACIEGKDWVTREIRVLAECAPEDYCLFQWMAEFRAPSAGMIQGGYHRLLGLKLVTRDDWLCVYNNGQCVTTPRDEGDKQFHYEGFGR